MEKMDINFVEKNGLLAYKYLRGSHSYHLNVETSDVDYGGVWICPPEMLLGLRSNYVEQVADEKNDVVYYEFGRWIELLLKSNPTALESLYAPKDCIVGDVHPAIQLILDNRDAFLSKECFNSFFGYANSQIVKARGLNKKIVNPVTERKDVLDFCYTFYNQGSQPIKDFLKEHQLDQRYCGLVNISNMKDTYGVYYDFAAYFKFKNIILNKQWNYYPFIDKIYGIEGWDKIQQRINDKLFFKYGGIADPDNWSKSNTVRLSSIPKGEVPICQMTFNKDAYVCHCRDYHDYKEWEKNRNPVRYESNLNKNYDCYLDSETEFLTINGWKKYDEISNDELIASFDKNHNIKYVPILNRISDNYSGYIYSFENRYTKFSVSENHKMYVSPIHRSILNNFSTKYVDDESHWELIKIKDLFNDRHSYYHQIRHLNNDNNDYNITDEELIILGAFLSEGSFEYNKKGEIKAIRITQYENKEFTNVIRKIKNINIKEYHFKRDNKKDVELSWVINDEKIINLCKECNGRLSYEKDLPLFYKKLSKRQTDILLNIMILSDGTKHKKGHYVYYTTSKKLAESLYTLLILNGYNCQFYGCHDNYLSKKGYRGKDNKILPMYQIFISTNNDLTNMIHFNKKDNHWNIRYVENERIVCFENENHTLVTKNNYKVAFHGNSKNVMHCMRLIRMAKELAQGKGFNLVRDNDRDYLLDIRNHKFEYEEFMAQLENEKREMEEAIKTTTLPDKVDITFVNDLLIKSRKTIYNF